MEVYEIRVGYPDGKRSGREYAPLGCKRSDDRVFEALSYKGKATSDWKPRTLRIESKRDIIPDIFSFPLDFVLNQKAYDLLGALISRSCELLPLNIEGRKGTFYYLNCTTVVEALQPKKSIWRLSKQRGFRMMAVPAFQSRLLKGVELFILPGGKATGLYWVKHPKTPSEDDLIHLYQSGGLKGLRFDLVWSKANGPQKPEFVFKEGDPFEHQTFSGQRLTWPDA